MSFTAEQFQSLILTWFDQHGRKHLPWQQNKTPYRVWISEIMLQQTQVATVIPYFDRFMQRFAHLESLASAPLDDVLHLWAGLGYYSRARNLHKAAGMILTQFNAELPDNVTELMTLPGIGRSTAGAIVSIAFNKRAAILDGNVKRVLARFHAIDEPVNIKTTENKLWDLAERYLPATRTANYTQAMMDIGATICTRSKPQCHICPLQSVCEAHKQNLANLLPIKKATRVLPTKTTMFMVVKHAKRILLIKRPNFGIWGGLWSLPELSGAPCKQAITQFCHQQLGLQDIAAKELASFRHTFSHYHLDIHPVLLEVASKPSRVMESDGQIWYDPDAPDAVGLPQPVKWLLGRI